MTPSPEQVRQAALNHTRPPLTRGARIKQALEHARQSRLYAATAVRVAQLVQP